MQIDMQGQVGGALDQVWSYLPTLLAGIGILLVGWTLAAVLGRLARTGLQRSHIDARAQRWMRGQPSDHPIDFAGLGGRAVFALGMVFVLVAFFQTLRLTLVTEPLNALLAELAGFAPRLLGAAVLLTAAWLLALVLRKLTKALIARSGLDARLKDTSEGITGEALSTTLGEAIYWLTLFLFLPAILGALAIDGLLGPVQGVTDQVLGFLPNIAAAVIILGVGWLAAKLLREVVRNLLRAVGADRLGSRVGLTGRDGSLLSDLAGLAVYLLVLVPVVIGALNALEMAAITGPASAMLERILLAVPAVFAAALLLGFALIVGRLLAGMAQSLLDGLGFDAILEKIGLYRPGDERLQPARLAAKFILVGVLLFASIEAAAVLGFASLASLLQGVAIFAGQAFLGLLILGLGFYIAGLAQDAIRASASPVAPVLGAIARIGVLLLAGTMALQQVGVGGQVASIAFAAIVGAVAVAAAIAFGIGGREVAREYLERWSASLQGRTTAAGDTGGFDSNS